MAPRKSKLISVLAAGLFIAAAAHPAAAEDYMYNYGSRSDTITLGAGDASRANIAIQHPTPWPNNVNDRRFKTPSRQGIGALEMMFRRYGAPGPSGGADAKGGPDMAN